MFKLGDVVKYDPKWCSEGEQKYIHVVVEVGLINPVTGGNRYRIETQNSLQYFKPTEIVDEEMIMLFHRPESVN